MRPPTAIPDDELRLMRLVVADAYRLGEQGRVAEGARRLDLQLAVIDWLPPSDWKEELVNLYRIALVGYDVLLGQDGRYTA